MNDPQPLPSVFVLGGNANTLAFTSSFRSEDKSIAAWLVPLAWTPLGASLGETWQRVNIAIDDIGSWVDQTFAPDDDRSFVASLRDIDMLTRIGWHAEAPTSLSESAVLNLEELPDDLVEALEEPTAELTQCAVCRRICVRDDFVWNERRLCAWDFHTLVFGRRGPWRDTPYELRHFATLPQPKYVVGPLLDDANVELVASFALHDEALVQRLINDIIAAGGGGAYLAARTASGMSLLRERHDTPDAADEDRHH